MTFEETLQELINHAMVIKASYKHQNALVLSGYIIKKPTIVKHDTKDVHSCSFVLYQLNEKGGKPWYESYSCITYIKDLVEQFEQLDHVIYVSVKGKLRYSTRHKTSYLQVLEIKTHFELETKLGDYNEPEIS